MWLVIFASFTFFAITEQQRPHTIADRAVDDFISGTQQNNTIKPAHLLGTTNQVGISSQSASSSSKAKHYTKAASISSRIPLESTSQRDTSAYQHSTTLNSEEFPDKRTEKPITSTPTSDLSTDDSVNNDEVTAHVHSKDSDFAILASTNKFVDKTILIKWIITRKAEVTSISVPRKFGKSTSLDMVKRFFEIPVDTKGKRLPPKNSYNYRLFTKTYFNNATHLDIFKDQGLFSQEFASRPVLLLNFKKLDCETMETFTRSFYAMLQDSLSSMKYMKYSKKIDDDCRQAFHDIENIKRIKRDERNISTDLWYVTKSLHTYFGNQCLVLIDEIDSPFLQILTNTDYAMLSMHEMNKITVTMDDIMNTLFNNNTDIWMGFCVGKTDISRLFHSSAHDHNAFHENAKISSFYASNYDEVDFLRAQYSPKNKMNIDMKKVEEIYDGYKIIDHEKQKYMTLFNTFSVRKYFESSENPSEKSDYWYWCAADPPPYVNRLLFFSCAMPLVRDSILGYKIHVLTCDGFGFNELEKVRNSIDPWNVANPVLNCKPADDCVLMQFLMELGYYTIIKVEGSYYTLTVPNYEIRQYLSHSLQRWTMECLDTDEIHRDNYIKSLESLSNDPKNYQEFVNSIAHLFRSSDKLPKTEDQFINVILLFFNERKKDGVVLEYIRVGTKQSERSYISILRHNTATKERAAIIIQATYRLECNTAMKILLNNTKIMKFYEKNENKVSETFLVGLNFSPFKISASILYNDTREGVARNYNCKIDTFNRYKKKALKRMQEWGTFFGG